MPLWKVLDNHVTKLPETGIKQEKLLEQHLENWVIADAALLGEPLLVIGRQVLIPDTKDRLDVLALDPKGNAVIVELKRGTLKDPVDVQALRYASYISKWQFSDFENQARNFLPYGHEPDFNFNSLYESFCEEAGAVEIPNLNQDQRIIIVGSAVRDKLGSVALWLRDHNVDIKVIEIHAYKDNEGILIEPTTIVPLPVSRFVGTGGTTPEDTPWLKDGKAWHLEKRCSSKTRDMLLLLDTLIQDRFEVSGPEWGQKFYVAYTIGGSIWLAIGTRPNVLRFDFSVKPGSFDADELASKLGVVKFDKDEGMSEKLNLPSSVLVQSLTEKRDRVRLRVKEGFDLESPEFLAFLEDSYKAAPK